MRRFSPSDMNCAPPPTEHLIPSFLPGVGSRHSVDTLSSITPPSREIPSFVKNMPTDYLIQFPTDSEFTERAARYSSFSCEGYSAAQFGFFDNDELSRFLNNQCLKSNNPSPEDRAPQLFVDEEIRNGREESSVTDPVLSPGEGSTRKRKGSPKNKLKMSDDTDLSSKDDLPNEKDDFKLKGAKRNGKKKQDSGNCSDFTEPYKDYIHVRARRGQATDSHSLAERVRREKIGQRMKLLQDLVPGCNKITGKAVMLDEIINYVQSLQRQVEFLSIKLSTLTPRFDCSLTNLISKEPNMSQANASLTNSDYQLENLAFSIPFSESMAKGMENHSSLSQMKYTLYQTPTIHPPPIDIFEPSSSQFGNLSDDELHRIIQISLLQNKGYSNS